MTSREQFEVWIKSETGFDLWRTNFPMTEPEDQQYKDHSTNLAWMAWQASREALKPVAWVHRLVNKHSGVAHPWVYGSAEKVCSEGDVFRVEVRPLYSNEES